MDSIDSEFRSVSKKIAVKFADLMNVKLAEQRSATIKSIEEDVEELDFIISGIEERARLEPRFMNDARQLRRERDQIVTELNRFRSRETTQRWQSTVAFEQEYRNRAAVDDSIHGQLAQGTQILERGSETVARTHNLALETEQIGVDTASELGIQREKLDRARDRLADTNADISVSHRLIQRLRCNALQNRMLLIIIILAELGVIGAIIAIKLLI